MKGIDTLALLDAIDRTQRELRILRALVLDHERQLVQEAEKPSRWPDLKQTQAGGVTRPPDPTGTGTDSSPVALTAPDPATLTHEVAMPDEVVEHIAECGE